jgi:hypothetical protein
LPRGALWRMLLWLWLLLLQQTATGSDVLQVKDSGQISKVNRWACMGLYCFDQVSKLWPTSAFNISFPTLHMEFCKLFLCRGIAIIIAWLLGALTKCINSALHVDISLHISKICDLCPFAWT